MYGAGLRVMVEPLIVRRCIVAGWGARQTEPESSAMAGGATHADLAPHGLDVRLGDVEAESNAGLPGDASASPESLEDRLLFLRGNARPEVFNLDVHEIPRRNQPHGDRRAVRRVLGGVGQQVHQHVLHPLGVAEDGE